MSDLKPDPENARRHDDANRAAIRSSLDQFGPGRSILADADGIIRAGNGTFEAAQQAGIPTRIVETDGSELVVVKRTDLRGDRAKAMGLADNRASEMASWDEERLAGLCSELRGSFDLDAIGLDEASLKSIAGALAEPETEYIIDPAAGQKLAELFVVPPFSIFDARQGYWQDRKRAWLALGIRSELGRGVGVHQYSEAATISRQNGTVGKSGGYKAAHGTEDEHLNRHGEYTKPSGRKRKATAAPGGAARPAMKRKPNGKTQRGDGRGRPIK